MKKFNKILIFQILTLKGVENQRHEGSLFERKCQEETPIELKLMMMSLYLKIPSFVSIKVEYVYFVLRASK